MGSAIGTGPYRREVLAVGEQPPPPTGPPVWDGPPPPGVRVSRPSPLAWIRGLPKRISIRWRLTITYAVLFFAAGAVLLLVMYWVVGWAIRASWPGLPDQFDRPPYGTYNNAIWQDMEDLAVAGARQGFLSKSLMALGGMGIIALMIGYVVADRALRPITRMTAAARRMSETSLAHERIDLKGPDDELKELADTFDAMLTRLNAAFDAQRRFVANASHELRTPLTINRTVLEVAISDPEVSEDLRVLGKTLLGNNARHEKLIEALLLLARSERELSVRKPLDFQEVGKTVVDQLSPFAEEGNVTIVPDLHSAPVVGDPVLLERCVANLVENAIKYNMPTFGKIWIRSGIVDGASVVQIANTGPHVPAYEVDELFEPFRRLIGDRVESAKGAGLGLSIVRAVVRAHGGSVTAVSREGGGLVVTVRLVASPVAPLSAR
ncbi:HAMP domain-containing protein [Streptosporangiaceae bacterium NEAU-GS5]|nr:HAMP domain-containing protein [Streptosporangiaceae bacterium NEAU-GS5]